MNKKKERRKISCASPLKRVIAKCRSSGSQSHQDAVVPDVYSDFSYSNISEICENFEPLHEYICGKTGFAFNSNKFRDLNGHK